MYSPPVPTGLNSMNTALLLLAFGYDHINCNPPVLIRTPKLTQFEPAQYWGGGPPGNSAVLYPPHFFLFFFLEFVGWRTERRTYVVHALFMATQKQCPNSKYHDLLTGPDEFFGATKLAKS